MKNGGTGWRFCQSKAAVQMLGIPTISTKVCGPLELCDVRLVEHFCDQLVRRFPRINVTCLHWARVGDCSKLRQHIIVV